MKKTIVYFYSNTGNNRFLAKKISERLNCDIEEIIPKPKFLPVQMFTSLLPIKCRFKDLRNKPTDYDNIIICGPLWFGTMASPIKGFLKSLNRSKKNIYIATCCGSSDEKKNDKFGYANIFKKLRKEFKNQINHIEAFPIVLALPKKDRENDDLVMKTRLSEKNFKGEIDARLNDFVKLVKK